MNWLRLDQLMSGQNGNKRIEILLKNQNIPALSFNCVDL